MPGSSPDFLRLLAEAKQGSLEATAILFEAFRPYLLSLANQEMEKELRAKGGGSDLVQETFIEVSQDISHFQGSSKEELLNWMRTVLLHNLANFHRHYFEVAKRDVKREQGDDCLKEMPQKTGFPLGSVEPDVVVATFEELARLERILNRLPQPYQQVVRWRSMDRKSFKEIATALDVSEKVVRRIWAKGIRWIHDRLNN